MGGVPGGDSPSKKRGDLGKLFLPFKASRDTPQCYLSHLPVWTMENWKMSQ